jgi:hypothetical protein
MLHELLELLKETRKKGSWYIYITQINASETVRQHTRWSSNERTQLLQDRCSLINRVFWRSLPIAIPVLRTTREVAYKLHRSLFLGLKIFQGQREQMPWQRKIEQL